MVSVQAKRIVKIFSCCPEPYPGVIYEIVIRRRPLFYIFNMMFPCVLITLIALLGFYLPSASGEKVTICITTLLSMTVFLMMVRSCRSRPTNYPMARQWTRYRSPFGRSQFARENNNASAPRREREQKRPTNYL